MSSLSGTPFIIIFERYHHISQVDYLRFWELFILNWPMPLTVPLGKVIVFSLFRKYRQDCARSVDCLYEYDFYTRP